MVGLTVPGEPRICIVYISDDKMTFVGGANHWNDDP
jgi:hypothetical protein